jgi:4-diphosphocytidyl-2-C-methyl-D-erythritol kinase
LITDPDLTLKAYAKVNLFLEVLGKRADGYHEIRTVYQAVSLCDHVCLKLHDSKISIHSNITSLNTPDNLAYRAGVLLKERFGLNYGVDIYIDKKIPIGAGLGGGSSDAAAVLKGLNNLWNLGLNSAELRQIGAELGMDVPFFIEGGTALGGGRGEQITSLLPLDLLWFVLVCPPYQISTADVYDNFDRMGLTAKRRNNTIDLKPYINTKNLIDILYNSLEEVTFRLYPDLLKYKRQIQDLGLKMVLMSGSGSALFGISSNKEDVETIYNKLCDLVKGVVFLTHSINL